MEKIGKKLTTRAERLGAVELMDSVTDSGRVNQKQYQGCRHQHTDWHTGLYILDVSISSSTEQIFKFKVHFYLLETPSVSLEKKDRAFRVCRTLDAEVRGTFLGSGLPLLGLVSSRYS
ncbi:hypothetical protein H920_08458 [Fukomys damarensis]|uniref:Uncharacterized protein n=1 Tax=Fukomys damarensis TaxID=885580 RepID=A0A091E4U2_FUKDA|nr:hypothetical protein H920_08458 [Fukomys damarensis]